MWESLILNCKESVASRQTPASCAHCFLSFVSNSMTCKATKTFPIEYYYYYRIQQMQYPRLDHILALNGS